MSDQAGILPPPPTVIAPPPGPTQPTPPELPRWGVQTGFFQRRQPAFWLFAVLLLFTTLTVLTEQLFYLQNFSAGWIFSIVLLTVYVVPIAVAIWLLDLFEREPISLVIAAFVWGGVVAIGLAVTVNTAFLESLAKLFGPNLAQTWGAAIVAPPVEETFKYLGVVVIYLIARNEFDDLFDGFVYGALVGLGFAAVENVQYFIQAVAAAGGADQIGPVIGMFVLRSILVGAYMHVMWTGLAGVGFAYYVTQRDQPRGKRIAVAAGLFVLAIVAHFIWNSPLLGELLTNYGGIFLFGVIKGLPFLGFLVALVYLATRREKKWFSTLTSADVGTDVLTNDELAQLGGLRSRWAARRAMGTTKGPMGSKLQGQLQREQINLAMIRSRAGSDDDPNVVAQRERIRAVRAQLSALPDVARPAAIVTAAPVGGATAAGVPVAAAGATPWAPTHVVPATGMASWEAPDPSRPPTVTLAGGVQLVVVEQQGAWSRVMGSNGWVGWVDGRLLLAIT
ncbi:MAG TPA: PrsW family intramembrane metalloprotease [Candidatus Limnocylindrales bacterium]|nr:PrsW family intramembrane metalloprotease [Candidatus Limnocylindrales bacterium]